VHVEVELALEVVRTKLAEVGLVPDDDVRVTDLVEACPAREKGIDGWRDVLGTLVEELALRGKTRSVGTECESTYGDAPDWTAEVAAGVARDHPRDRFWARSFSRRRPCLRHRRTLASHRQRQGTRRGGGHADAWSPLACNVVGAPPRGMLLAKCWQVSACCDVNRRRRDSRGLRIRRPN
jgi:hypothetical protein